MFKRIKSDIKAIFERDPAARSTLEVVLCYPGFQALQIYRVSNWLWKQKLFLLGRLVSHIGRLITAIEIHPGATIGERFFVDHGFGTVIGETAIIGDDVTLYHDVTLGGVAPSGDDRGKQRHPIIENNVIVGAGAQLLGPITIGEGSRIGSNAVVVRDVEAEAVMVGVPAHSVTARKQEKGEGFDAYCVAAGDDDPLIKSIREMHVEIRGLQQRLQQLENMLGDSDIETINRWEIH
ncbi:MAG: serine O-acetyltransferase [Rickettsiales bacterium]|nr:serine O-acetyltransferase [Rickettsiales bacterium]